MTKLIYGSKGFYNLSLATFLEMIEDPAPPSRTVSTYRIRFADGYVTEDEFSDDDISGLQYDRPTIPAGPGFKLYSFDEDGCLHSSDVIAFRCGDNSEFGWGPPKPVTISGEAYGKWCVKDPSGACIDNDTRMFRCIEDFIEANTPEP